MNAESSRSHLIIGILIESTNLTNGVVHRGKVYPQTMSKVNEIVSTMHVISVCVNIAQFGGFGWLRTSIKD